MKSVYRGHEIEVYRETSVGGVEMIYYSVFNLDELGEPWIERLTSFTDGEGETVRGYIQHMKARIDAELSDDSPWGATR